MKKIVTIFSVGLLTFSLSAQIEGEMKFGIFTGVNYAMPFGDDMKDAKDDIEDAFDDIEDAGYDAEGGIYGRLGFHVGFGMDYFVIDNLAITSSLSYSQKGFLMKQEVDLTSQLNQVSYYDYYGNITAEYITLDSLKKTQVKVQLDYLDLPIGIKFQTDEGVTVFGGILFSFLVNQNVKFEYEIEEEYTEPTYATDLQGWNGGLEYVDGYKVSKNSDSDSDSDDYDDIIDDDDPNPTLTGLQVGIGYTVGNFNIAFKLNRNSNFGDVDGYGDDNHNVTLQLSTGLTF